MQFRVVMQDGCRHASSQADQSQRQREASLQPLRIHGQLFYTIHSLTVVQRPATNP